MDHMTMRLMFPREPVLGLLEDHPFRQSRNNLNVRLQPS